MAKPARRESRGSGFRRILCPTDFSPLAAVALPPALRLAKAGGAELVLLHVLSLAALSPFPDISGEVWTRLEREAREAAQGELQKDVAQIKRSAPRLRVRSLLCEGVPSEEILRAARRLRCDLIVLATHGRTGLRHVLLGSVAENVVRRGPCPVLTVRPAGLAVPARG